VLNSKPILAVKATIAAPKIVTMPHPRSRIERINSDVASSMKSAESIPESPRYSVIPGITVQTPSGISKVAATRVAQARLAQSRKHSGIRIAKASRSQPR